MVVVVVMGMSMDGVDACPTQYRLDQLVRHHARPCRISILHFTRNEEKAV